ncbi:hypothetical protein [Pararoseomonas baculiformis]|uniref:hypothetical protein n=1 Tax=Pararoseomonas baculiformis TaxID=2820812 RepID=UPI001ADF7958|nr:hypothetical protein [Pararoseomonas baculiformis]
MGVAELSGEGKNSFSPPLEATRDDRSEQGLASIRACREGSSASHGRRRLGGPDVRPPLRRKDNVEAVCAAGAQPFDIEKAYANAFLDTGIKMKAG